MSSSWTIDCGARARDVRGLVVQVGGPAEQVHGHVPGPVADREALAVQLDAALGDDLVEAQLAQEDVQPPFPGDPRGAGTSAGLVRFVAADAPLEVLPDLHQVQPGP